MYQTATITMNDNFHPHVTWRNPANRHQGSPNLTHITRDQSFYVWLVAWNMTAQRAYILKTVMWNMQLDIDVDPSKPLGKSKFSIWTVSLSYWLVLSDTLLKAKQSESCIK